jgi:hypothetical protein
VEEVGSTPIAPMWRKRESPTGLTELSCLEGIIYSQSIMPQLDKFTYFTQFFWSCLFLFTFFIPISRRKPFHIETNLYFFYITNRKLQKILYFLKWTLIVFFFLRLGFTLYNNLDSLLFNFLNSSVCYVLPTPEGIPILEGIPVPEDRIWGTPAQALYFPTLLHVPGEIEDPLTLYKLSKLNGYILFFEDLHKEMNPAYTLEIQQELDRTAAVSLPNKLEFFIGREESRFKIHTLRELLFFTYSQEPYFLPANLSIFEESVRLTLHRFGFLSSYDLYHNNQLDELIFYLRLQGRHSLVFSEVLKNFLSHNAPVTRMKPF